MDSIIKLMTRKKLTRNLVYEPFDDGWGTGPDLTETPGNGAVYQVTREGKPFRRTVGRLPTGDVLDQQRRVEVIQVWDPQEGRMRFVKTTPLGIHVQDFPSAPLGSNLHDNAEVAGPALTTVRKRGASSRYQPVRKKIDP